MISLPAHTFISAKGTDYEGNILTFIVGERKYYAPSHRLLFIRQDDGNYIAQPHRDAYCDAIWEKYFAHMSEVMYRTMFTVCAAFSRATKTDRLLNPTTI